MTVTSTMIENHHKISLRTIVKKYFFNSVCNLTLPYNLKTIEKSIKMELEVNIHIPYTKGKPISNPKLGH